MLREALMMLMNKKGGEYVEASIVLPLLVLLIVSMILCNDVFFTVMPIGK